MRQTQVELTHRTIMEAMAKIVVAEGEGDIVKRVAREAQVSERTVYRHYPSKDILWDSFLLWVSEKVGLGHYPETCEEMVRIVPEVFAGFDAHAELLKACLSVQAWSDVWLRGRTGWQEGIEKCLRNSFGDLDPDTLKEVGAIVHLNFNGINWKTMRDQWGFDGQRAGMAAQWALHGMFRDLAKRRKIAVSPAELKVQYAGS